MFRISVWVGVFLLVAGFVLPMTAQQAASSGSSVVPGTITGSGTADFIPRFTGTTTIGNSNIFETVGGNVGVATTTPAAKLDVNGTGDFRDTLTLFPKLSHSALSIHGTAFAVGHTGLVTFVSGQTFPGTGTVTSVGSGSGLTGGPITHSGTLSIATGGVTNAMLQNSTITVNAGTDLTGGGTAALGGTVTLNLDTTKISVGYSSINVGTFPVLNQFYPGVLINKTAPVANSGTYYLSASALLDIDAGDTGGDFCFTTTANNFPATDSYSGSGVVGTYQTVSMTDVFFMNAGDSAEVWCYDASSGDGLSFVYNSNLTATLMNSASAPKPRHAKNVPPPGTRRTE